MIKFYFYSTHYKVYIYLPCINTHRLTTWPFNSTHVLSSRDRQMPILYHGSADCCEGNCKSDVIRLIQPSLTIHYCNQLVLAIVPDLNIFIEVLWFWPHFDKRPGTVLIYYVLAICITGWVLRLYNFGSLADSSLCDHHYHMWVHCIVTAKICYYILCCFVWFLIILFDSLYSLKLH